MSAYSRNDGSPLAVLVDEQRLGSAGGQAMVGIAGIVLAIVLVVGQISLATTKGIATHLHASVEHMTEGNQVMESVIERAAPSAELEKVLASQSKTLAHTRDAMAATNEELELILKEKHSLIKVVGRMDATSGELATGVDGVNASTKKMTGLLGTLPSATARTHAQLAKINADTTAINVELSAIAAKMQKYGLPLAKGAPTG
ncbi:MAG: hypothetical protein JWM86_1900 [Thermoleophilia bacterium]|nr:hypothetical protein [Thermoleophilia bacterium]